MAKLAIIGASYLQLPVYLKAMELGLETIGFAWPEGAVAKDFCTKYHPISTLEKEQILQVCANEQIDGILTIATDIAVPTVNYVASKMGLTANSIYSGTITTNKFFMRQVLFDNNIKSPAFFKVNDTSDLHSISPNLIFPVIVKPVDRSGSKGVTKVEDKTQLLSATINALNESLSKTAIIESFINGLEVSVETISHKGRHYILTITDKITSGPPHFVELEHHQPSNLSFRIQKCIKEVTLKALTALRIEFGASHSEFIIAGEDIYITEVGARMGGDFIGSDLVYLSTGYDFLKGIIGVALNQFEKPNFKWLQHSGVLFYTHQTPSVKRLADNHKIKPFIKQSEFDLTLKKELKQSADRSGYFIYQANTRISNNNINI